MLLSRARMKPSGFDASHAVLVRPFAGGYQIISGHNWTTAAHRAGLEHVPAWVREMDDETVFMQLVLSNAQGELSPLERGMHALAGVRAGGTQETYARTCGVTQQAVSVWVIAAEVAETIQIDLCKQLLKRTTHLAEIHATPPSCWPLLVSRPLEGKWSFEQAKVALRNSRGSRRRPGPGARSPAWRSALSNAPAPTSSTSSFAVWDRRA